MRRMQAHYANSSPKLPSLTALLLGGVQRPNKVLLEHLWLSSFSFCQRSFKAIQFSLMATVAARFGRRERLIEHAISLSCVAGFDESVTEQSKIVGQGKSSPGCPIGVETLFQCGCCFCCVSLQQLASRVVNQACGLEQRKAVIGRSAHLLIAEQERFG